MKRFAVMSCLLLLTTVGLGKVGLSLLDNTMDKPVDVLTSPTKGMDILTSKPAVAKEEVSVPNWSAEWLVGELIPSAEAAKAMPLDEERGASSKAGSGIAELQKKQKQLEIREKELDEREKEVKSVEKRAADKIVALEALQKRIQDLLTQEDSIKDKKIKRLTAVYEGMKAERAAPVIAQMDLDIVVKIFLRMSEKQVGKILSFLQPQKAVVISQALTKRISSL